jgi:hypothetical protein
VFLQPNKRFIRCLNSVYFLHFWTSNEALEFYSDSAGGTGSQKGFGIYFQGKWAQGSWPLDWAKNDIRRDITFLELSPVVVLLMHYYNCLRNLTKLIFELCAKTF